MGREKDIISEQEFNLQVANRTATALPEDDSPGDSEFDAGEEFDMGVEFTPDSALFDDEVEDVVSFDQTHSAQMAPRRKIEDEIPASARGISSELPSPWLDNEKASSTN
jgi:hypothetical protein